MEDGIVCKTPKSNHLGFLRSTVAIVPSSAPARTREELKKVQAERGDLMPE